MKRSVALAAIALVVILAGSVPASQPGEITVGDEVSVWDSALEKDLDAGINPVGGDGQLNGEFTIAERDGIQIALRATDRTDGLLEATRKGNKGRYVAPTGFDNPPVNDRAEWNYDWHVDLRGTGTTLGDYDLTLTQTYTPILFGDAGPFDLTFDGAFTPDNTVLFQESWNPVFGNDIFDPERKGTYNLKLTLKPKRGGKPLTVQIQVKVR